MGASDRPQAGAVDPERRRKMKHFVCTLVVLALGLAAAVSGAAGGSAGPSAAGFKARWDIASYQFAKNPVAVSAGGLAAARASDGSKIVLTGTGTFGGSAADISGGGRWSALDAHGAAVAEGTYTVKSLVAFYGAPGSFGDPTGKSTLADQIGNAA